MGHPVGRTPDFWARVCFNKILPVSCTFLRLLLSSPLLQGSLWCRVPKSALALCRKNVSSSVSVAGWRVQLIFLSWNTVNDIVSLRPDLFSSRERYWHPTSLKIDADCGYTFLAWKMGYEFVWLTPTCKGMDWINRFITFKNVLTAVLYSANKHAFFFQMVLTDIKLFLCEM